jgi:RHS repeat-associated protein
MASEDPDTDYIYYRYPLRFPGQYFDNETRLHYNYFRDYDPGTGRYCKRSDQAAGASISTSTPLVIDFSHRLVA